MIKLSIDSDRLVLQASAGDLAPRHESQLAFWDFDFDPATNQFLSPAGLASDLLNKVTKYLTKCECPFELGPQVKEISEQRDAARHDLVDAIARGRGFKDGVLSPPETPEFLAFLEGHVPRKLKEHQIKAALHLLTVRNGANFSVPGSGKTSVVLTVFQYLRKREVVDALFVVGPPACFGPWRVEYEETLGLAPSYEVLAGGDIDQRRSKYLVNRHSVSDLYLTSFQTLMRDWEHVRILFEHQGIRFFFVIDEAHYIKRLDGAWALAALAVARHAERHCALTGTPYPHGYSDAFNLFDALWPYSPPISEHQKREIKLLSQQNGHASAAQVLDEAVSPLFYRVRKNELGLSPQRFHEPIQVPMHKYEKLVYDAVFDKIRQVSQSDNFRDIDLIMRLGRGRIMRLRQCVSYAALLGTAVEDYSENLLEDDLSLANVIRHYDELETPAKLEALMRIVQELREGAQKVVVWANFIGTLKLIREAIVQLGIGVRLIYGDTPIEKGNVVNESSRESFIRDFVNPDSGVDVLVANPAACAESISLHKTCSHAIYYDLSYNCAQYLQSLDRIHRVGGSENKEAHYHFLQYENSLDQDILANLQTKAKRMSDIIDQDYPIYSLDMFDEDQEVEAYERLFGKAS